VAPFVRRPCGQVVGDPARKFVKEPGAEDAGHYMRRVQRLAVLYLSLFVLSLAGIVVLVWRAQLFVTLAQRSNVETLTLAFLMVFFGYVAVLSAPGAWGCVRLARYGLGGDRASRQQRLLRGLGQPKGEPRVADLNVVIESTAQPGAALEIAIADDVARMGRLVVDGARVKYHSQYRDGSNEVLAYFEQQVGRIVRDRGEQTDVDIVTWKSIDDDDAERYHAMVEFARNLERQLDRGGLWPRVRLEPRELEELERRMGEICPALRVEGFLPHWDYEAEHKLPIIPEPLGLISLSRAERRVDPVSSMMAAAIVSALVLAMLVVFIISPPWVPGA
jgi:hypothetical protein